MIRAATRADVPHLLRLVRDLAEYEHEPESAVATDELMTAALFPQEGPPAAFAHVVDIAGEDGPRVVGMAVWFTTFSTWTGRPGIWLEDLYVEPEHRGAGWGKALLATLAAECVRRGLPRLEWTVLDWNTPAIEFYRSLQTTAQQEWTTQRLTGDALARLADQAQSPLATPESP